MPHQLSAHEQAIYDRIRPLRNPIYGSDVAWHRLEPSLAEMGKDYEGLELNPDFQRGHVWTEDQQSRFIENCLRRVVAADGVLLHFNCPNFSLDGASGNLPNGLQCMDGLQRYTAITRYVNGHITAFGYSSSDLDGTLFSHRRLHVSIAIHNFQSRAELLEHYLTMNAGGTPHSESELQRVRSLLNDEQATSR